jgi:hypothetical protein
MENKIKRLCICFVVLWAVFIPVFRYELKANAEGENTVYLQTPSETSKGTTNYVSVLIKDLSNVASLKISIHYDASVVTINNYYYQLADSLKDSSIIDGALNCSFVFDSPGVASDTYLISFYYSVSANTQATRTYFDVVVEEAFDSSLNSVDVKGTRFGVNISESTAPLKQCYVYGTSGISTKIEEEFEVYYRFNTTDIAAGTVEIKYDRDLFEFVSFNALGFLDNKMVDVNADIAGTVMISFLGTEPANSTEFCIIKFKTVGNVNTSSDIEFTSKGFYDSNLDGYACNGLKTSASLTYDKNFDTSIARMLLSSAYDAVNELVTVTVKLTAGSKLGAGDFVINWDAGLFTLKSYKKKFSPTYFNVNDKKATEGILKLSVISLSDITSAEDVLEIVFDVKRPSSDTNTAFTIDGNGLSDSLTVPIDLNFVGCKLTIPGKSVPDAPASVTATSDSGKVYIEWSPVNKATKYLLQKRYYDGSAWKSWNTVSSVLTDTRYEDSNVTNGVTYQYRVYAYSGEWSTFTRVEIVASNVPLPPETMTAGSDSGKVDVSWSAVEGATKYLIRRG